MQSFQHKRRWCPALVQFAGSILGACTVGGCFRQLVSQHDLAEAMSQANVIAVSLCEPRSKSQSAH
jgi:hypothetical protein